MPEVIVAPDGVTVRAELKLTRAELLELVREIDAERARLHEPAAAE